MSHPYFIVDVFAEAKYAGNQLAVVLNAHDLSSAQMQSIAREMHFSETTFILGNEPRDGGYDVRIFTPEVELPFAGHPTLGTSFILRNEIIRQPVASLLLNLKVGQIPVSFQQDIVWMKQIAPTFGRTINFAAGAELLQIDGVDLDTSFPIQQVSTGLPFWIMPLKSLRAVKMARPNWVRYLELTEAVDGRTILVFAPETYHPENQLNVRVFGDQEGIPEDPATGSGNGCLAAYLVKYRYLNKDAIDVRVEQGYEINRPSLLWLRAQEQGGKIDVNVGGKVFMVARGELVEGVTTGAHMTRGEMWPIPRKARRHRGIIIAGMAAGAISTSKRLECIMCTDGGIVLISDNSFRRMRRVHTPTIPIRILLTKRWVREGIAIQGIPSIYL